MSQMNSESEDRVEDPSVYNTHFDPQNSFFSPPYTATSSTFSPSLSSNRSPFSTSSIGIRTPLDPEHNVFDTSLGHALACADPARTQVHYNGSNTGHVQYHDSFTATDNISWGHSWLTDMGAAHEPLDWSTHLEFEGTQHEESRQQAPYTAPGQHEWAAIPESSTSLGNQNISDAAMDTVRQADKVKQRGDKTTRRVRTINEAKPIKLDTISPRNTSTKPKSASKQQTSSMKHNEVEKKYRKKLNGYFADLLSIIPAEVISGAGLETTTGKSISKAETLMMAEQYIKKLEADKKMLDKENEALVKAYERLKGELVRLGGTFMP